MPAADARLRSSVSRTPLLWSFTKGDNTAEEVSAPAPAPAPAPVPPPVPVPACCHTMVRYGRCLVVFGGGVIGEAYNSLAAFDVDTRTWEALSPAGGPQIPARLSHSAVVIGSKMYVYGGLSLTRMFNDLWAFDFTERQWARILSPSEPDCLRRGHQAIAHSGKMYVFMGFNTANLRDIWQFDPQTSAWTEVQGNHAFVPGAPPVGLSGFSICCSGDDVFTFGGIDRPDSPVGYTNKVYRYSIGAKQWTEFLVPSAGLAAAPAPRYSAIMWIADRTLYIHGGDTDSCGVYFDDCWALDVSSPTAAAWSRVEQHGPAPSARSGHCGVFVEGTLYSFGGESRVDDGSPDVIYSACMHHTPVGYPLGRPLQDLAARWIAQVMQSTYAVPPSVDVLPGSCRRAVMRFIHQRGAETLLRRRTADDF